MLVAGPLGADLSTALMAAGAASEPLTDPRRQIAGATCILAVGMSLTDIARLARLP